MNRIKRIWTWLVPVLTSVAHTVLWFLVSLLASDVIMSIGPDAFDLGRSLEALRSSPAAWYVVLFMVIGLSNRTMRAEGKT